MLDIINRIFGKDSVSSKEIASERLRLVLIHDRASMSTDVIEMLKEELIKVIQNYMEIDTESLCVNIENEKNSVALVANIPIKGIKRGEGLVQNIS